MADRLSPAARSVVMRAVRGRDTAPELRVRRLLHAAGYRFRVQYPFGRKRLDIAFTARKRAVLIHGCFWHGHDCPRGRRPTTNTDFWNAKISRNRERDDETRRALGQEGWNVLTLWECTLATDETLLESLHAFLGPPRAGPGELRYAASASSP